MAKENYGSSVRDLHAKWSQKHLIMRELATEKSC